MKKYDARHREPVPTEVRVPASGRTVAVVVAGVAAVLLVIILAVLRF